MATRKETKGLAKPYVKNGKTYYRVRKTINNERKEFTATSAREAEDKFMAYLASPIARSQKDYLKMPFYVYLEECNTYFKEYNREIDFNAYDRRNQYIAHIKKTPLGKAQLGCVTDNLIKDFLFLMVDKELAVATINKDYFYIKRCLKRACEKGILKSNPADLVAPLKEREGKKATRVVEPFEIDDMNKLIKEAKRVNTLECRINGAIGERVYGTNADVLIFQMYSGLRIGEALGLTWKCIDFDKGYIDIQKGMRDVHDENGKVTRELGTLKTDSSKRSVKLYKEAKEILLAQRAKNPNASDDDLVFVNEDGRTIDRHKVNRTLKAMAKRCNCSIQDVGSHSMRHSFGAYLVTKGVSIYRVSRLMGHSSIRMTEKVYAKILDSLDDDITMSVFDELDSNE